MEINLAKIMEDAKKRPKVRVNMTIDPVILKIAQDKLREQDTTMSALIEKFLALSFVDVEDEKEEKQEE